MTAKLIKTNGNHYDLYVESIGLYTSTYQWTSNGNLLSRENCEAIERGYDLKELFNDVYESINYHEFSFTSFRLGFQKALELMGDKKFSEAQMREAYDRGFILGGTSGIDRYIQALQQSEWDVEVEMDILNEYDKPKFDAEGCLILKRV